jgi:hypothetical protein
MKGFSLTAIVLEESIEKALLSDVETAGWQKPVQPRTINIMPSTLASARVDFTPSANPQVGDYVAQVTGTLSILKNISTRWMPKWATAIPAPPSPPGRVRLPTCCSASSCR